MVNTKNYLSFFNNNKTNKGISNLINSTNNSFNQKKKLILYNNTNKNKTIFIKRNPVVLNVNLGLKKINTKNNYITSENSFNSL